MTRSGGGEHTSPLDDGGGGSRSTRIDPGGGGGGTRAGNPLPPSNHHDGVDGANDRPVDRGERDTADHVPSIPPLLRKYDSELQPPRTDRSKSIVPGVMRDQLARKNGRSQSIAPMSGMGGGSSGGSGGGGDSLLFPMEREFQSVGGKPQAHAKHGTDQFLGSNLNNQEQGEAPPLSPRERARSSSHSSNNGPGSSPASFNRDRRGTRFVTFHAARSRRRMSTLAATAMQDEHGGGGADGSLGRGGGGGGGAGGGGIGGHGHQGGALGGSNGGGGDGPRSMDGGPDSNSSARGSKQSVFLYPWERLAHDPDEDGDAKRYPIVGSLRRMYLGVLLSLVEDAPDTGVFYTRILPLALLFWKFFQLLLLVVEPVTELPPVIESFLDLLSLQIPLLREFFPNFQLAFFWIFVGEISLASILLVIMAWYFYSGYPSAPRPVRVVAKFILGLMHTIQYLPTLRLFFQMFTFQCDAQDIANGTDCTASSANSRIAVGVVFLLLHVPLSLLMEINRYPSDLGGGHILRRSHPRFDMLALFFESIFAAVALLVAPFANVAGASILVLLSLVFIVMIHLIQPYAVPAVNSLRSAIYTCLLWPAMGAVIVIIMGAEKTNMALIIVYAPLVLCAPLGWWALRTTSKSIRFNNLLERLFFNVELGYHPDEFAALRLEQVLRSVPRLSHYARHAVTSQRDQDWAETFYKRACAYGTKGMHNTNYSYWVDQVHLHGHEAEQLYIENILHRLPHGTALVLSANTMVSMESLLFSFRRRLRARQVTMAWCDYKPSFRHRRNDKPFALQRLVWSIVGMGEADIFQFGDKYIRAKFAALEGKFASAKVPLMEKDSVIIRNMLLCKWPPYYQWADDDYLTQMYSHAVCGLIESVCAVFAMEDAQRRGSKHDGNNSGSGSGRSKETQMVMDMLELHHASDVLKGQRNLDCIASQASTGLAVRPLVICVESFDACDPVSRGVLYNLMALTKRIPLITIYHSEQLAHKEAWSDLTFEEMKRRFPADTHTNLFWMDIPDPVTAHMQAADMDTPEDASLMKCQYCFYGSRTQLLEPLDNHVDVQACRRHLYVSSKDLICEIPWAVHLLRTCAVIGRSAPLVLLRAVYEGAGSIDIPADDMRFDSNYAMLRARGFLLEERVGTPRNHWYLFSSTAHMHAIYESIPKDVVRNMHLQVGTALTRISHRWHFHTLIVTKNHLNLAHDQVKVLPIYMHIAKDMYALNMYEGAYRAATQALKIVNDFTVEERQVPMSSDLVKEGTVAPPETPSLSRKDHLQVLLVLARSATQNRQLSRKVEEAFETAKRYVASGFDRCQLAAARAQLHLSKSHFADAIAIAKEGLEEIDDLPNSEAAAERVPCLAALAESHLLRGELYEARGWLKEMVTQSRKGRKVEGEAIAVAMDAFIDIETGDFQFALESFRSAANLFRWIDNVSWLYVAQYGEGLVALHEGKYEEALKVILQHRELMTAVNMKNHVLRLNMDLLDLALAKNNRTLFRDASEDSNLHFPYALYEAELAIRESRLAAFQHHKAQQDVGVQPSQSLAPLLLQRTRHRRADSVGSSQSFVSANSGDDAVQNTIDEERQQLVDDLRRIPAIVTPLQTAANHMRRGQIEDVVVDAIFDRQRTILRHIYESLNVKSNSNSNSNSNHHKGVGGKTNEETVQAKKDGADAEKGQGGGQVGGGTGAAPRVLIRKHSSEMSLGALPTRDQRVMGGGAAVADAHRGATKGRGFDREHIQLSYALLEAVAVLMKEQMSKIPRTFKRQMSIDVQSMISEAESDADASRGVSTMPDMLGGGGTAPRRMRRPSFVAGMGTLNISQIHEGMDEDSDPEGSPRLPSAGAPMNIGSGLGMDNAAAAAAATAAAAAAASAAANAEPSNADVDLALRRALALSPNKSSVDEEMVQSDSSQPTDSPVKEDEEEKEGNLETLHEGDEDDREHEREDEHEHEEEGTEKEESGGRLSPHEPSAAIKRAGVSFEALHKETDGKKSDKPLKSALSREGSRARLSRENSRVRFGSTEESPPRRRSNEHGEGEQAKEQKKQAAAAPKSPESRDVNKLLRELSRSKDLQALAALIELNESSSSEEEPPPAFQNLDDFIQHASNSDLLNGS